MNNSNSSNVVTTENGAISLATTGSARVDFFFKILRDTPTEKVNEFLEKSWKEGPLDTLRLVFHLRDCRGGKGEKKKFHECMIWLVQNHPKALQENLQHVPHYGSFKDWLSLLSTGMEDAMITEFCKQLIEDKAKLSSEDPKTRNNLSLAAKWAVTEGCYHDKTFDAAAKFATKLKCKKVQYRKDYIAPLRAHLKLVETMMSEGKWDQIDFSKVPSCAFKKYSKAFKKHSPELYDAYISKVKSGEAKMNTGQLHPHEILKKYIDHAQSHGNGGGELSTPLDETVEARWKSFIDGIRKKWSGRNLGNALAIVDVSGSMHGTPLCVSVSLGMLLASLTEGPFKNKWITFSDQPVLEELKGHTAHAQIEGMMKTSWSMNTNLQGVFDLILTSAKLFNATPEQMPTSLFIFSDMQFNQTQGNVKTNFEVIKEKYAEAGYKAPTVIFWCLRGDTPDFPTSSDEQNVALVSGFSPSLLDIFLEERSLNPYYYMKKVVDSERYARITLSS